MRHQFLNILLVSSATSVVSAYRWYNWQLDLTCKPGQLFVPENETQLVNFVKAQHHDKTMLKVVGNGHAFGNMSTCVDKTATSRNSTVISLTNFDKIKVNTTNNRVTFGAGWDLVDLVPELRDTYKLSVTNLGTERVQNFVGAFTTGTHGTGRNLGNLATQVVGFRVMDAMGDIKEVNEISHKELLPAYRVSLGALGIITEVTIQAEPLKHLKRTTQVFNIDTSPTNFTKIYTDIKHNYYDKHDRVMVWGPHMTWDEDHSRWSLNKSMSVTWWDTDTTNTDIKNCSTDYCANGCGNCLRDYVCYDESSDALSTPPAGVCNRFFYTEIEHFVPIEHFIDAAGNYSQRQLDEAPKEKGLNNMNMINEIRFVKGDDTWMSPANNYSRAKGQENVFAVLEIDWYMTYNNYSTLWAYQDLAKSFTTDFGPRFDPRPHWGKMSWFDEAYALKAYPKLKEFLKERNATDPDCQFVNEFLIDHLGLTYCKDIFKKP